MRFSVFYFSNIALKIWQFCGFYNWSTRDDFFSIIEGWVPWDSVPFWSALWALFTTDFRDYSLYSFMLNLLAEVK